MLSSLLITLALGSALVDAQLACLDESGKPVDWYIVYKIPRQPGQPAPLDSGYSYAFLTGKSLSGYGGTSKQQSSSFRLSKKLVTDESSIFGKTLAPLYKKPTAYSHVMYNDAPPEEAGTFCSHASRSA